MAEPYQFKPGNEFWKQRSSHGRNPKFETAEQLHDACQQYFEWVANNPLKEEKIFAFQGTTFKDEVSKMRAMTITGLCIFIDVSTVTWGAMKKRGDDFLHVMRQVENVIKTQKFEGAAADMLSSNIIARDLGLVDKQETEGTQAVTVNISDQRGN